MSPLALDHVRELAARKSKAYELLLALDQNLQADGARSQNDARGQDVEACFQHLAQIVDRMQFFEISLDAEAQDRLLALVKNRSNAVASTLAALALTLSEAEPDRGSIQILLAGYPKWLKAVSDLARPSFLGILPNIALHLEELGDDGVDTLIACLNACDSAEDCEILGGCIDRYRETSGSILIAAAEIASAAIRANLRPVVDKLITAVSPEEMLDSKPARDLLPAIAMLKTAGAMAVCVTVAAHNHSSALHLAKNFPNSLSSMKSETQLAYLNALQAIVEETGTSLLGYGTKQLPALFHKAGEARATEFVALGVAIARRYGRLAAEEFFEQKTAASKLSSTAPPSG